MMKKNTDVEAHAWGYAREHVETPALGAQAVRADAPPSARADARMRRARAQTGQAAATGALVDARGARADAAANA